MDIVNYLRQLFFIEEKVVEEEVYDEDTFFECGECEDIVVEQAKQDDDCDFCMMVGVDICCLHRASKTFGMAALAKTSIVNSDKKCKGVTINYGGHIFNAVFSNTSNRWILVYDDENESINDMGYELFAKQMYEMYLNMMKGVKDDRCTFVEYKAMIARDKIKLNKKKV